MQRWAHRHHFSCWEFCLLMLRLNCNAKNSQHLSFLWCFVLDMPSLGLIWLESKLLQAKSQTAFPQYKTSELLISISLGPKDICLGFHDKEATRILMFMSKLFYYLPRKLLYLVFVCHFISTLQIFAPNPVWFYLCILCVSTYTWCCNILPTSMHNKHARTHTHTHTSLLWQISKELNVCLQTFVCVRNEVFFENYRVPMKRFAFLSNIIPFLLWLKTTYNYLYQKKNKISVSVDYYMLKTDTFTKSSKIISKVV